MKNLVLLLCLMAPLGLMAQEQGSKDTTLYVNGRKMVVIEREGKVKVKVYEQTSHGDTIENDKIFEGVYKDGQSTEQRFALSVPFVKKKKSETLYFDGHYSGVHLGYNSFGSSDSGIDLVGSKSWEIGISVIQGDGRIWSSSDYILGWVTGVAWGYASFRLADNHVFLKEKGQTIVSVPNQEGEPVYKDGRLRYNYFRAPLLLELQNNHSRFFISAGLEAEVRYRIKSKAKSQDGDSHTIGSDMSVPPIGLNFLAQAGLSDLGCYARYSLTNMFKNNMGPDMHPLTIGVCWWW